jgi:hypothetical protein
MFFIPSGLSSRKYEMAKAKTIAIPKLIAPFFIMSPIMDSVGGSWLGWVVTRWAPWFFGGFAANARLKSGLIRNSETWRGKVSFLKPTAAKSLRRFAEAQREMFRR